VDILPSKMCGISLNMTYSCSRFINLTTRMDFLTCSFVESFFSGSNLHRNFSGCLGKG
jgi:hypothetical protein